MKAHELAELGNLKITVVIRDEARNILYEFNSCPDFTVEKINEFKRLN